MSSGLRKQELCTQTYNHHNYSYCNNICRFQKFKINYWLSRPNWLEFFFFCSNFCLCQTMSMIIRYDKKNSWRWKKVQIYIFNERRTFFRCPRFNILLSLSTRYKCQIRIFMSDIVQTLSNSLIVNNIIYYRFISNTVKQFKIYV